MGRWHLIISLGAQILNKYMICLTSFLSKLAKLPLHFNKIVIFVFQLPLTFCWVSHHIKHGYKGKLSWQYYDWELLWHYEVRNAICWKLESEETVIKDFNEYIECYNSNKIKKWSRGKRAVQWRPLSIMS